MRYPHWMLTKELASLADGESKKLIARSFQSQGRGLQRSRLAAPRGIGGVVTPAMAMEAAIRRFGRRYSTC